MTNYDPHKKITLKTTDLFQMQLAVVQACSDYIAAQVAAGVSAADLAAMLQSEKPGVNFT